MVKDVYVEVTDRGDRLDLVYNDFRLHYRMKSYCSRLVAASSSWNSRRGPNKSIEVLDLRAHRHQMIFIHEHPAVWRRYYSGSINKIKYFQLYGTDEVRGAHWSSVQSAGGIWFNNRVLLWLQDDSWRFKRRFSHDCSCLYVRRVGSKTCSVSNISVNGCHVLGNLVIIRHFCQIF